MRPSGTTWQKRLWSVGAPFTRTQEGPALIQLRKRPMPAAPTTSSIQRQIAAVLQPAPLWPQRAFFSTQTKTSLCPQCAPSDSHPAKRKVRQTRGTPFLELAPATLRSFPSEHQPHSRRAETQQQKIPPLQSSPISQPATS